MNAKEECEVLLNEILPLVQHLLKKNHEFYPVGAVMHTDGTTAQTAACDTADFPPSAEVLRSLSETHQKLAQQKKIKASAIAYDASVTIAQKKTDCIMIRLEHQSGYAVTVGLPYTMNVFKKIKYGELFATQGTHDVFA